MEDNLVNAKSISFINFINSFENNIYIPLFQRDYNWKIKQCERFYEDFWKLLNNQNYRLFLVLSSIL